MSGKSIDDILGVTEEHTKEDKSDVSEEQVAQDTSATADSPTKSADTEKKKSTSTKGSKQSTKSKEKEKETKEKQKEKEISADNKESVVAEVITPPVEPVAYDENIGAVEEPVAELESQTEPESIPTVTESSLVSDVTDNNDSVEQKSDDEEKEEDEGDVIRDYTISEHTQVNEAESPVSYPIKIVPSNHVAIYRGPSTSLRMRDFGGCIEVLGAPDSNGFSPVRFFRSEFGMVRGYIRMSKEVINKCRR